MKKGLEALGFTKDEFDERVVFLLGNRERIVISKADGVRISATMLGRKHLKAIRKEMKVRGWKWNLQ